MVRLDEDGKPHSVRVLQTIVLKRLGDYVLTIPAPVLSVNPGPRTESQPGRRENQILWEGFSPGRRVLAAWADLRVAESVAGLPVEVSVEPGEVTIRNATAVTVPSFTADPVPASIAEVSSHVRASIRANLFPEGLNVALHGKQTPEQLRVAAPLRVRGVVRVSGERVPFSGLLDGIRRPELRVPIPDGDPKLEMRVQTADIDAAASGSGPARSARSDDPARAHLRAEAPVRPVPVEPGPDRAELRDLRLPNESTSSPRDTRPARRGGGPHGRLDRARPWARGRNPGRRCALGPLLAATDDEPDREAAAPGRAGPRALSDHTTDAARVLAPRDPAHATPCSPDSGLRPSEGHPHHPRDSAPSRRRWWRWRWRWRWRRRWGWRRRGRWWRRRWRWRWRSPDLDRAGHERWMGSAVIRVRPGVVERVAVARSRCEEARSPTRRHPRSTSGNDG